MADPIFPEDDAPIEAPPERLIPVNETNDHGSRWVRLTKLKRALPLDHPWAQVYDDLVTRQILDANRTGERWKVSEPIGILILLEEEAVAQGLIEPGEAPRYTTRQCIGELAAAMRIEHAPSAP